MPWASSEDAKAKAIKILGKDADMPKEKVDFDKISKAVEDGFDSVKKARDQLEAALLECDNALSSGVNAVKQTQMIYEKSDFGLNPKKPEDAKKIKQARQLIGAVLAKSLSISAQDMKSFEELEKHAIQVGKYKCPSALN